MAATPAELAGDLRRAGAPVDDLWQLVNANIQYRAAIPVLIDWLRAIDERVPAPDRRKSARDSFGRCLVRRPGLPLRAC